MFLRIIKEKVMPETKRCPTCKGKGSVEYLLNQHDDKKEWDTCHDCGGKGEKHYMTDEEERDYHADYW